jgi:hypothetical protein
MSETLGVFHGIVVQQPVFMILHDHGPHDAWSVRVSLPDGSAHEVLVPAWMGRTPGRAATQALDWAFSLHNGKPTGKRLAPDSNRWLLGTLEAPEMLIPSRSWTVILFRANNHLEHVLYEGYLGEAATQAVERCRQAQDAGKIAEYRALLCEEGQKDHLDARFQLNHLPRAELPE